MGGQPPSIDQVNAVGAQIQPSSASAFVNSELASHNGKVQQTRDAINTWSGIAEAAFGSAQSALSEINRCIIDVGTAGPPFESINVTARQLTESTKNIHDNLASNAQAITNLRDLLRAAFTEIDKQASGQR